MSYEPNTTIPWGNLVNSLSDQTDLQSELDLKANLTLVGTQVPINAVFTDTIYNDTNLQIHLANNNNPHSVNKTDVGLSLVENTKDIDKPVSTATTAELNLKENKLGVVSTDYMILVGRTGTDIREWRTLSDVNNISGDSGLNIWGNIEGDILNQDDLQQELDSKEQELGLPLYDRQVLHSRADGTRYWDDVAAADGGSGAVESVNGKTGAVTLQTSDIAENVNLYFTDVRADARIVNAIDDTTYSNTTLYSSNKINSLVSGALTYLGGWDANTNNPSISDASGSNGDYYKVTVAGTQDLGSGSIDWSAGADVIHNGTVFEEFESTNAVDSVNTKVGVVVLDKTDIGLSSVDDTSDVNKPVSSLTQTELNGKETSLGNPGTDGYILSSTIAGARSWIEMSAPATGTAWGDITGTLSAQTDLDTALGLKATQTDLDTTNGNVTTVTSGLSTHEGLVDNPHSVTKAQVGLTTVDDTSDADKPVSTATQTALNLKADTVHNHNNLYYLKSEFIDSSAGGADAGKPVVLDSNGKLDLTMVSSVTSVLMGNFTPTGNTISTEYPDTAGINPGEYYIISAVDDINGWTFTSGQFAGYTGYNGDAMQWTQLGEWAVVRNAINESTIYKLDGTQALTAPLSSGGQLLSNIADGIADTDASSVGQMNTALALKSDTTHNHTGVYEPIDSTIVRDADIGVTVQPYDATIVKDADIGVTVEAYDVTLQRRVDSDITAVPTGGIVSNMFKLTQAEYDGIAPDAETFYIIVS